MSVVKPKNDAEKIEISLSDNDRVGYYDDQALAELVYPYRDEIDLESFKVDLPVPSIDLTDILSRFAPEPEKDLDAIPEEVKPVCKRGQIWQLGRHRLMCGDSTEQKDVKRLMKGKKAKMVFTDPPYGIDLDTDFSKYQGKRGHTVDFSKSGGGHSYSAIRGDDKPFDPSFIFNLFGYCNEIFLWGGDFYVQRLPEGGTWFCWDKRIDEGADKMYGGSFELCWSKARHRRQFIRKKWIGFFGLASQDVKRRIHPTQKPIEVCSWFIGRYSKDASVITDLFLGSGTTLIACEQLSRICYGMEIEPKYCDVTIARWEDLTGKKAKLVK